MLAGKSKGRFLWGKMGDIIERGWLKPKKIYDENLIKLKHLTTFNGGNKHKHYNPSPRGQMPMRGLYIRT